MKRVKKGSRGWGYKVPLHALGHVCAGVSGPRIACATCRIAHPHCMHHASSHPRLCPAPSCPAYCAFLHHST
jgi:hypothetical protein